MTNEKLLLMIKKIYERTKADKLKWEETEKRKVFQVALAEFSIRISPSDVDDNATDYILEIYNSEGALIETVYDRQFYEQESKILEYFREIYEKARRTAFNVDGSLDKIMNELNGEE